MSDAQKCPDCGQSGMYVNCVYCGHRYGPGSTTPVSKAIKPIILAEQEACAKAVCIWCDRVGEPWRGRSGRWWHGTKWCDAGPIRERMAAREGQEEAKDT